MSSLRTRLLVALLGAVLLVGVIASAATYYNARTEIGALLDEEMRQVALSLRDHAVLDVSRLAPGNGDPSQRVVVQIWDPRGVAVYLSNAATPMAPPSFLGPLRPFGHPKAAGTCAATVATGPKPRW